MTEYDYYDFQDIIRKNTKPITVIAYKDRVKEFEKNDDTSYLSKYYNKPIITSKTIKKPYYCPKGQSKLLKEKTKEIVKFHVMTYKKLILIYI